MHRKTLFVSIGKILTAALLLATLLNAPGGGSTGRAQAQGSSRLEVEITAAGELFGADEAVSVSVTMRNPGVTEVGVLRWFTPEDGVMEPLFRITRAGEAVGYRGPLVKRASPTSADYLRLPPGESLSWEVDLSESYDLAVDGTYQVTYAVEAEDLYLGAAAEAGGLGSNTLEVFIEGRAALAPGRAPALAPVGSTSFVDCTGYSQADMIAARNVASNYAANAVAYFNLNRQGARYVTWFGVYEINRYDTVAENFNAIRDAMDYADPMEFNCAESNNPNFYAYVYPDQPYKIWLGGAFWDAPMTGTDSKAGTLIHEVSHFWVVADTTDHVYGQTGAKNLAISDPTKAIENADNHEYFAENTPPLEAGPTYTISGNAGTGGATMTYTGGTTTADANGNYTITVDLGWTVTVTPSKSGYTFNPASRSYTNVTSNQSGQNYTAMGGMVSIAGNAGTGGASLAYTGGTATADANGNYLFAVASGWSGTVTPSKAGFIFTPASRSYTNLTTSLTSENYTATPTGGSNLLLDPSFEAYTPNPFWTEYSDNFETPLCTEEDCGDGDGTAGPRTGMAWSWFGGTDDNETGWLSQSATFPSGSATLSFYLWIGDAEPGSGTDDTFSAKIDGNTVFETNATQEDSYPEYTLVSLDVGAWANGGAHTVSFHSTTSGQAVNFNLDDVALTGAGQPGPVFSDVAADHWAKTFIERLYNAGITTGCSTSPLAYCPNDNVSRAQMAVFLERGMNGAAFIPPAGTGMMFSDVLLGHWAVNWIEKLFADGITTGCSTSPLAYCPENPVTRAQMAVFLLRAKYGAGYVPPAPSGVFTDLAADYWAAGWIERLYAEGITTGCSTSPLAYCPEDPVTRAQMAVFLVRTFALP